MECQITIGCHLDKDVRTEVVGEFTKCTKRSRDKTRLMERPKKVEVFHVV